MNRKKVQFFRPKDKGVLRRAARYVNTHPNLNDIEKMAQDTTRKTRKPEQVMGAIRTIIEAEKIKSDKTKKDE